MSVHVNEVENGTPANRAWLDDAESRPPGYNEPGMYQAMCSIAESLIRIADALEAKG